LPVVAAVTQRFVTLLTSLAPGLPLVVLPATLEQMSDDELEQLAPRLWEDLVSGLTSASARADA
jgi:hypothetical protein